MNDSAFKIIHLDDFWTSLDILHDLYKCFEYTCVCNYRSHDLWLHPVRSLQSAYSNLFNDFVGIPSNYLNTPHFAIPPRWFVARSNCSFDRTSVLMASSGLQLWEYFMRAPHFTSQMPSGTRRKGLVATVIGSYNKDDTYWCDEEGLCVKQSSAETLHIILSKKLHGTSRNQKVMDWGLAKKRSPQNCQSSNSILSYFPCKFEKQK